MKVLIGIPSINDNDRFRHYRDQVIDAAEKSIGDFDHQIFVTPPTQTPSWPGVVECCNLLIDKCVREGWDYLWIIQGDVTVPRDAFRKLYSLDVDVAQGYVPYHHDFNSIIVGFLDERKRVWHMPREAIRGAILHGWVFAGLSCTLIKRRVFEGDIPIRFKYQPGLGEDILFMYDVQVAGFVARVHGDVECGHLPEWPLQENDTFDILDVGCGHSPQGDVNIDLHPEATGHRSIDQRVCSDKPLDVRTIRNFVKGDGCQLPFKDGSFEKVFSSQTIEHVSDPELMLKEMIRVSNKEVEVICPDARSPWGISENKPLHINPLTPKWFSVFLAKIPNIKFHVRSNTFEDKPGDIFVKIVKVSFFEGC